MAQKLALFSRKLIAAVTLAFLAFPALPAQAAGATHTVSDCAQLIALGADNSTDQDIIKLTADLDCTALTTSLYPGGFQGTLDGQGHTISNIAIDDGTNFSVGLFSSTFGATIRNVKLGAGTVMGGSWVGGLVGGAWDDTIIENVSADIEITCRQNTCGGLVGSLAAGSITNSSADGDINGGTIAGGLVGQLINGTTPIHLSRVHASGNINIPGGNAGGLIGIITASDNTVTIEDAYATGNIPTGSIAVGGLIGWMRTFVSSGHTTSVSITRTYATGAITGIINVGALIGRVIAIDPGGSVSVSDSFATGHVSGSNKAGLIGNNEDTNGRLTSTGNSFDTTGTGLSNCTNSNALSGCTGIDTSADAHHFMQVANAPLSQWDFATVWQVHAASYPTLRPDAILDSDGDGITDVIENAGPNSGDANGDSTQDALQANVATFLSAVTAQYVTLEIDNTCVINSSGIATEASQAAADTGYSYPAGLLNFTATCDTVGHAAAISVYLPDTTATGLVARKLYVTHTYSPLTGAAISTATVGGQSVTKLTYTVTDGSLQDDDGAPDSVITDPVGLGLNDIGVPNTGVGALAKSPK